MCFKDWEFPHFMGDLDMNLPGMSTTHVKVRLPLCKRLFKEEYHIHITGNAAISLKNAHRTANSASHQKCKESHDYESKLPVPAVAPPVT